MRIVLDPMKRMLVTSDNCVIEHIAKNSRRCLETLSQEDQQQYAIAK